MHLHWELPSGRFEAVVVDLEVVSEPSVPEIPTAPPVSDLYFWAVQANFHDSAGETGGAHLGLQWNRRHAAGTAVNWGGYHRGGSILTGTDSPLPSTPNDPNTRDYGWHGGTVYRLEIARTPDRPGWWRGTVTDTGTGTSTVVRDLNGGGDHIRFVSMWSEVFARCDHPAVTVRWSRLRLRDSAGIEISPEAVTVNYQSHSAGGCANTTARAEGAVYTQTSNTDRVVPQGTRLTVS